MNDATGSKAMERERAVVWLTKYALSGGVKKCECEISEDYGCGQTAYEIVEGKAKLWASFEVEGRHWHRTRESATARVEVMRKAKIASLKKQISKLEKPIEIPE